MRSRADSKVSVKVTRECSTQSANISQVGGGMKQGKKRASSEIQDVENSGNFYKLVLKKKREKKWYRYHTYWYRYQPRNSSKVVLVPHLLVPVLAKAKPAVHFWY